MRAVICCPGRNYLGCICVYVQLQRWVQAFRSSWFHVRVMTNNGVERQNRALKYDYLLSYRNSTLSGLVSVLVERFHPDAYQKYVKLLFSQYYPILFMNSLSEVRTYLRTIYSLQLQQFARSLMFIHV